MTSWNRICASLKTGKSGGIDAVNKPLLLMLILSAAARRLPNLFVYPDCEKMLRIAQRRFGADPSSSPHMAFWHLQADGCWEIENAAQIPLGKDLKRPTISTMRKLKICARVPDSLWQQIVKNPDLRENLANSILSCYFRPDERAKVAVYFMLN